MTHSPSSSELYMREFSLTRMEDRSVNQAILYMQVTIIKVPLLKIYYFSGMVHYFLFHVIPFNASRRQFCILQNVFSLSFHGSMEYSTEILPFI